jgi:hypothetical protein
LLAEKPSQGPVRARLPYLQRVAREQPVSGGSGSGEVGIVAATCQHNPGNGATGSGDSGRCQRRGIRPLAAGGFAQHGGSGGGAIAVQCSQDCAPCRVRADCDGSPRPRNRRSSARPCASPRSPRIEAPGAWLGKLGCRPLVCTRTEACNSISGHCGTKPWFVLSSSPLSSSAV